MSTTQGIRPGRFVWHDLVTPDVARSKAFYLAVFSNWKVAPGPVAAAGDYQVISAGGEGIGGLVAPAGRRLPPGWLCYVEVADVDRACEAARTLDGSLLEKPTDIPQIGRFAVLRDPQGATFALFTPQGAIPERTTMPSLGEFCWYQLQSPAPELVARFYRDVCGWTTTHEDGPMGPYLLCRRGEQQVGGLSLRPSRFTGPGAWLPYAVVEDVDAATKRGEAHGGQVDVAPVDLKGLGRFSVLRDPHGTRIALFVWTGTEMYSDSEGDGQDAA